MKKDRIELFMKIFIISDLIGLSLIICSKAALILLFVAKDYETFNVINKLNPFINVFSYICIGVTVLLLFIKIFLLKLNEEKEEVNSLLVNTNIEESLINSQFILNLENETTKLYIKKDNNKLYIVLFSSKAFDKDILNKYFNNHTNEINTEPLILNIIHGKNDKKIKEKLKSKSNNILNVIYEKETSSIYYLKNIKKDGMLEKSIMLEVLKKIIDIDIKSWYNFFRRKMFMFNENEIKTKMDKAIEALESKFTTVRAGRANPNILNGVMVSYYGSMTPIQSLATISVPEARQLVIKPFDKSTLKDLEKAIYEANLGLNPTNNGEILIITIPELTEETRKNYVKQVKDMAEEARIQLRNIRQDANNAIKKQELSEDIEKDYLDRVQKLINKYNTVVEEKFKEKEQELLSI